MNLESKIERIRNEFRIQGETKEAFVFQFLRSLKGKSESDLTPQDNRLLESFLKLAHSKKKGRKNKKKK